MCIWQSHEFGGALSFGGCVPAEFVTCCASLSPALIPDAVAPITAMDTPLMNVRRATIVPPFAPVSIVGHCGWIFAALTTFAHFAISAWRYGVNSLAFM